MSIEIVLIPLAIALTKEIAEGVAEYKDQNRHRYTLIETRMKDEELLKQALEEWSCTFRWLESKEMIHTIKENEVTFWVNHDGCYALVLPETADKDAHVEWLNKVEESYTHYLQQRVYQNLLKKAEERGMILETEEYLEDNSIQITYILNK